MDTSHPSSPVHGFTDVLFRTLLRMDAEAVPTTDGVPTGLNWYGKFRHPTQARPQTEPSWTQRLEELLSQEGYIARREVRYPDNPAYTGQRFCDNVMTFADGSVLWLENKGAWKEWWRQQGKLGKFRSHLLESVNSALHDVEKITSLSRPHADWVGVLLLGFDSLVAPIEQDIPVFCESAKFLDTGWHSASMHWPDRWRNNEQIHAWFWWRPTVTA